MKDFAPANYQTAILNILGENAATNAEAKAIFAAYGLNVNSVRAGRSTKPVIFISRNARDEDGLTVVRRFTAEQAEALAQFADTDAIAAELRGMAVKPAPVAAETPIATEQATPALLTTVQAARLYTQITGQPIGGDRISQLIRAGRLPSTRAGNYHLIARGDLEFFAAQPRPAARPRK